MNKNYNYNTKQEALKDYITVNERIQKFYKVYPNGRIITELVSLEDGMVIFKASIYRDLNDAVPSATGYAYEKENSSFITKTSYIEVAETSAVGRGLAMLGLEIKKSISSYEEVANAKLNQENKEVNHKFENKVVTPANKNLLLSAASKKGYTKEVFEGMLEKKYHCNLSNIDMNTFNTVYSNLNKVKCAVAESN